MSDYYRRRRVMFKDSTALLMFFIAFVWSGAFVWPILANGVDDGDMMRGLAYFLATVFGAGIVAGLIGLEMGNILGGVWERYHRLHRHALAAERTPASDFARPALSRGAARRQLPSSSRKVDPTTIQVSRDGVYAASYLGLAQRVRPDALEVPRLREALARTTNIGAWDGGRLVGAVRVLSDGYTFTALADIIVEPEYQGLGLGKRLMAAALAASADGRLFVEALPECAGFFERVGCDRGPTGFVMRRPAVSA